MEVYETISKDYWCAEVILNEEEWPPIDHKNYDLFDRPIRKWVYENLEYSNFFFSADGRILFRYEEDLLGFVLAWLSEHKH